MCYNNTNNNNTKQNGGCRQLIEFRKIKGDVLSPPMAHEGEKLMENL